MLCTKIVLRAGRYARAIAVSIVSLHTACEHSILETQPPALFPTLERVRIVDNVNNVVSAVVSVETKNAVAVAIEFGTDSLFSQSTPFIHTRGDST